MLRRASALCGDFRPAGVALLPIVGEAMQPTLRDGDEVMIQRSRAHDALHDGLYAIRGGVRNFREAHCTGSDQKSHFCPDRSSVVPKLGRCAAKSDQCRRKGDLDWLSSFVSGCPAAYDSADANLEAAGRRFEHVKRSAVTKFPLIAKVPRWGYCRGYYWRP